MESDETVYSPSNAFEVATFVNGCWPSDPDHLSEVLYHGPKGVWFLRRRRADAETIVTITPKEAQKWLTEKCFYSPLASYFGVKVKRPPPAVAPVTPICGESPAAVHLAQDVLTHYFDGFRPE